MYCNHCGVQLPPAAAVCPACRQPAPATQPRRVERNLTLLTALWFAMGALRLLAAVFVVVMAGMMGAFIRQQQVPFPVHVLLIAIAGLVALFAIASLAVGWGLHQRASWGRPLAIVMAFISLLSIPFGTALGIYTLAILLPREAEAEYASLMNSGR